MCNTTLAAFILASVLLSIAPGPDNLFVLTQSALYGVRSGVLLTLGLCTGLVVHTTAVAFGVAALFSSSTLAFDSLKVLGAAYLLYLAWQAFRVTAGGLESPHSNLRSGFGLYRRGIIMNVTNPKVSLFFLAFLPQFASPEPGPLAPQIFLLGAVFIGVALAIFSGIALVAGGLSEWLLGAPKARIVLNRVAGGVFVVLAVNLLLAGGPAG